VERQRQAKKTVSNAPGGGAIMNVEGRSQNLRRSAEGCESVIWYGDRQRAECCFRHGVEGVGKVNVNSINSFSLFQSFLIEIRI